MTCQKFGHFLIELFPPGIFFLVTKCFNIITNFIFKMLFRILNEKSKDLKMPNLPGCRKNSQEAKFRSKILQISSSPQSPRHHTTLPHLFTVFCSLFSFFLFSHSLISAISLPVPLSAHLSNKQSIFPNHCCQDLGA